MARFYWVGLKTEGTPTPSYDIRGPFNTAKGRDAEVVKNSDFWNAANVTHVSFETEGRKLDEARALSKQLTDSIVPNEAVDITSDIPQSPEITSIPSQNHLDGISDRINGVRKSTSEPETFGEEIDSIPSVADTAKMERAATLGESSNSGDISDIIRKESVASLEELQLPDEEIPGTKSLADFEDKLRAELQQELEGPDFSEDELFSSPEISGVFEDMTDQNMANIRRQVEI